MITIMTIFIVTVMMIILSMDFSKYFVNVCNCIRIERNKTCSPLYTIMATIMEAVIMAKYAKSKQPKNIHYEKYKKTI